jgi:N-ethylmaleimide reductase
LPPRRSKRSAAGEPASGCPPSRLPTGIATSDPQAQFDYIVGELDKLGLAFIHVIEGATGGPRDVAPFDFDALRRAFSNTYIANNGYDLTLATERLAEDKADLFAFGGRSPTPISSPA